MKFKNLINLKVGNTISYRTSPRGKIYKGEIEKIFDCSSNRNGICQSRHMEHYNNRCIGKIHIQSIENGNSIRCGANNEWSLVDPDEFLSEDEFKI